MDRDDDDDNRPNEMNKTGAYKIQYRSLIGIFD